MKKPLNRVQALRKARKWTQERLAEVVIPSTTSETISRLENGKIELTLDWMQRIADALGCDPVDIISGPKAVVSETGTPVERMNVVGEVQSGSWRTTDDVQWDETAQYQINIPTIPEIAGLNRFGLIVRGPSMNLRYLDGDILICVLIEDLQMEPPTGSRVIVYRANADDNIEATCKLLKKDDEGKSWLWPESSHPDHQQPLPLDDGNGSTVRIHALVVGSVRHELPSGFLRNTA